MRKFALLMLLAGLVLAARSLRGADRPASETREPRSDKLRIERLDDLTGEDLRKNLLLALDLYTGNSNTLIAGVTKAIEQGKGELRLGKRGKSISLGSMVKVDLALNLATRLMLSRPDLAGLRIHLGLDCRLSKEAAEDLQALSRKLPVLVEACIPESSKNDPRPDPDKLRERLLGGEGEKEWLRAEAIEEQSPEPHDEDALVAAGFWDISLGSSAGQRAR
jgi:hypothetical protein